MCFFVIDAGDGRFSGGVVFEFKDDLFIWMQLCVEAWVPWSKVVASEVEKIAGVNQSVLKWVVDCVAVGVFDVVQGLGPIIVEVSDGIVYCLEVYIVSEMVEALASFMFGGLSVSQ